MFEKEEIFRYMKTIGYQDGDITSVAIFPSGAFLSISRRGILYKWNKLFNVEKSYQIEGNSNYILQAIKENHFIAISSNKNCSFWEIDPPNKNNEPIVCYYQIKAELHKSDIFQCCIKENKLIICSKDLITFWEENQSNPNQLYFLQTKIYLDNIQAFLLIQSKDYFVIGSKNNVSFWNYNNVSKIKSLDNITINNSINVKELDKDTILCADDKILYMINMNNFDVKKLDNFEEKICGICVLDDYFFVAHKLNLRVYRKDNSTVKYDIEYASMTYDINGIIPLAKNIIGLYSNYGYIRLFADKLLK